MAAPTNCAGVAVNLSVMVAAARSNRFGAEHHDVRPRLKPIAASIKRSWDWSNHQTDG